MAASKRAKADWPAGLVYDSGALIAADRDDRRMWALHSRALLRGVRPIVPAVALLRCGAKSRRTWRDGLKDARSKTWAPSQPNDPAKCGEVFQRQSGR